LLWKGAVLALDGGLAAGKTTLTRGIALGLGVEEAVTSPTFTLISEYDGRFPFYHMDAYRLSSGSDFDDIGADELLYGNGVCVVEWSAIVRDRLPPDAMSVTIVVGADGLRKISILGPRLEKGLSGYAVTRRNGGES
jgi:tRNA threonylcarbamoyladenosine biosynthesis protein TsaE